MSYTQGQIDIRDATGASQPVDAAIVANTGSAPGAGQAARQIFAQGDASSPGQTTAVDTNGASMVTPSVWQENLSAPGNLTSGQNFTSAPVDRTVLGEKKVFVSSFAVGIGSASSGLVIQGSDDTTNWVNYSTGGVTVGASSIGLIEASLTLRYWRVSYTNGAGTQTSHSLLATCQSVDSLPTSLRGNSIGGNAGAVSVQGANAGFPMPENLTQVAGTALGAPTAAGTSASGNVVGVQGVTNGVPHNVQTVPNKATFRAAMTGLVSGTGTAVAEIAGNATTAVRISRIILTGTAATGGVVDITAQLRTAAATGGTSSNATVTKADSADGAASSTPKGWTVTGGTLAGSLTGTEWAERILIPTAAATGPAVGRLVIDTSGFAKPIILRGTTQVLDLVWTGTLTTPTFDVTFEYTEE